MPRAVRKQSETDIYHVVNRGSGSQIIFENDVDKAYFLKLTSSAFDDASGVLLAWCLMDNHFHLVIKADVSVLSHVLQLVQSAYAGYFNRVYGRSGALFGNRFKSEPITSEEYLLAAVRYVHNNPVKAGICRKAGEYVWSSYNEYVGSEKHVDTSLVLGIVGGKKVFKEYHNRSSDDSFVDFDDTTRRFISDEQAAEIVCKVLGRGGAQSVKSMSRQARDAALVKLKEQGLGVRQIQRLTGVSLGTISNAGK